MKEIGNAYLINPEWLFNHCIGTVFHQIPNSVSRSKDFHLLKTNEMGIRYFKYDFPEFYVLVFLPLAF